MSRPLTQSVTHVLGQLSAVLGALTDEEYTRPLPVFSGASIGDHVRHIIEFFLELEKGYRSGYVNYDARGRDKAIERRREVAAEKIRCIAGSLAVPDRALVLQMSPAPDEDVCELETSYLRELAYNLEHAIHHMALLKIGMLTATSLELPEHFGVAGATIRYRKSQCAP